MQTRFTLCSEFLNIRSAESEFYFPHDLWKLMVNLWSVQANDVKCLQNDYNRFMLNYLRIKQYVLWCFDFYSILFGVQTPCNFNDPYRLSSSLHLISYNLVIHYLFPFFLGWFSYLFIPEKCVKKKTQKPILFSTKRRGFSFLRWLWNFELTTAQARCQLNVSSWQFDISIPPIV